jgi:hypothetical protein
MRVLKERSERRKEEREERTKVVSKSLVWQHLSELRKPWKSEQKQKLDTRTSCEVDGLQAVCYLRIVKVSNMRIFPKL